MKDFVNCIFRNKEPKYFRNRCLDKIPEIWRLKARKIGCVVSVLVEISLLSGTFRTLPAFVHIYLVIQFLTAAVDVILWLNEVSGAREVFEFSTLFQFIYFFTHLLVIRAFYQCLEFIAVHQCNQMGFM